MKKLGIALLFLMSVGCAFASTTTLKWQPGWGNLDEPLNYSKSKVTWSVNSAKRTLTVKYTLVGATPNKLYGAGVGIFCKTFASTFGQFPVGFVTNGDCDSFTFQGVTATAAGADFAAVLTDINGDGSVSIVVGPITAGTYDIEFAIADPAAGCGGNGGVDFQAPGPKFGESATITIP